MTKPSLTFDDISLIPKYGEILSRNECILKTQISKNYYLDIPIVASPMDTVCESEMAHRLWQLGGLGFIHRFGSIEWQVNEVKCVYNAIKGSVGDISGVAIGAAIGVKGDYLERATALVEEGGATILLIDVAHGHHILVKKAIEELKQIVPGVDIIAGNVVTWPAVVNLVNWGADGIRVGLGNGSTCTTRIMTGVGIPQVSALLFCAQNATIPIIADGGVRTPGDVCKALACGASTVMLGSLLAGTDESPGEVIKTQEWPKRRLLKEYRGSASLDSKMNRGEKNQYIEGDSTIIPYKGPVDEIILDILDGLRSSMSYLNARTIKEFQANAEFVEVTNAGAIEAKPHLLLQ